MLSINALRRSNSELWLMKRKICLALAVALASMARANINLIDIAKVTTDPSKVESFRYLVSHQQYYTHWTPQWNADITRAELVLKLKAVYRVFSPAEKNAEAHLVLGDVAHYLYNLEAQEFYDSANKHYELAREINPADFRSEWFQAFHYAQSSVIAKGIPLFLQVQNKLPSKVPAEFWEEYAWTMAIANMPSHSLFAMEQARKVMGAPGNFEKQMGSVIQKQLMSIDRDSSYRSEKMWSYRGGSTSVFVSRPLGIRLQVDSLWDVMPKDYSKRFSAFVIAPPVIKSKSGREIHYTIAYLIKVVDDHEQLDDYLKFFTAQFATKKKIAFPSRFQGQITYEIKDKNMYPDMGGGHLYVIGIERPMPAYPGLALEAPSTIEKGDGLRYYRPLGSRTRFAGKIFYAIMLDTCEDIHDGSLAVFKEVFQHQTIVE